MTFQFAGPLLHCYQPVSDIRASLTLKIDFAEQKNVSFLITPPDPIIFIATNSNVSISVMTVGIIFHLY